MQRLWMIWVSLLSAQFAFVAVAALTPPVEAVGPETWIPIAAAAAAPAGLSIAWGRLFSTDAAPQSKWIVRWAMAEAVGVLGLTIALLGGPVALAAVLFAASGLLTAAQFPRADG